MHIDRIIEGLTRFERFPRKALSAAVAQKEEVTPVFLRRLEDFLAAGGEDESLDDLIFFIVHLLGEFREARAFPLVMDLISLDAERVYHLLGDATTETLSNVVASLYDGDLTRLQAVIEDPEVDEFVRAELLRTLAFLTWDGRIARDVTAKYLLGCYNNLVPQGENHVWVGWQEAISLLGLHELEWVVENAFRLGRISAMFMRFEHFQKDLAATRDDPAAHPLLARQEIGYFGDTIGTLSRWHSFTTRARQTDHGTLFHARDQGPYANEFRDVGRNDPCPCGSGKKFKKCCLNATADAAAA